MSQHLVHDSMPLIYYHLANQLANTRTEALTCGIVSGNSIAYTGSVTDPDNPTPVTNQTAFPIGSISKTVTTTLVQRLAADGKINLTDRVEDYVEAPQGRPDVYKDMRIEHLLTHTAGLARQGGIYVGEESPYEDVNYADADPQGAYKRLEDGTFVPPGKEYNYSNFGYQIAGKIIERVAGVKIPQLGRERILEPLGMNNTYFTRGWRDIPQNRLLGNGHQNTYGERKKFIQPEDNLARAMPNATDMWSTSEDMCRFLEFLLRGNEDVLPEKYRRELVEPHRFWKEPPASSPSPYVGLHEGETPRRSIALDLASDDSGGQHGGHMMGYLASIRINYEAGVAVVMLGNAMDASVELSHSQEILDTLVSLPNKSFGNGGSHELSGKLHGVYRNRFGEAAVLSIGKGLVSVRLNRPTILGEVNVLQWTDDNSLYIAEDGQGDSRHERLLYYPTSEGRYGLRDDFGEWKPIRPITDQVRGVNPAPPQVLRMNGKFLPPENPSPTITVSPSAPTLARKPPRISVRRTGNAAVTNLARRVQGKRKSGQ